LTLVADFLASQKFWLGLLGGAFLFYLGIKTLLGKPAHENSQKESKKLGGDYFSTFALTLSNPMTIFSFIAVFGGLSSQVESSFRFAAFLLVLGVFCGSALWWLTLSTLVNILRQRLNQRMLTYMNKIAALVIITFAFYLLFQAIA